VNTTYFIDSLKTMAVQIFWTSDTQIYINGHYKDVICCHQNLTEQ